MRRLFTALAFCAGFCASSTARAQASQPPPATQPPPKPATQPPPKPATQPPPKPAPAETSTDEGPQVTTTFYGDTGLWFVPTANVLRHKQWSASLYRVNYD